jgi:hypothetical protein
VSGQRARWQPNPDIPKKERKRMPVYDVVIVGKAHTPEIGGGPIIPPGGGEPPMWPGSPPERPHPTPPGIWGGPGSLPPVIMPPIVIPPGFIAGVHPEHPIVIVPPGHPAHPIVIPPDLGIWPPDARPEHPIVIPQPPVVWPPLPTHPIVLPPPVDGGPPKPPTVMENWSVVAYWTEEGGWAMAIVPTESHPGVPTPSATRP